MPRIKYDLLLSGAQKADTHLTWYSAFSTLLSILLLSFFSNTDFTGWLHDRIFSCSISPIESATNFSGFWILNWKNVSFNLSIHFGIFKKREDRFLPWYNQSNEKVFAVAERLCSNNSYSESRSILPEYHPRYSPLITLFSTVTFLLCQNASLVSSSEWSIFMFSIYWNEYFPFIFRWSIWNIFTFQQEIFRLNLAVLISRSRHFQPNSGEWMVAAIQLHSCRTLLSIWFHPRYCFESFHHLHTRLPHGSIHPWKNLPSKLLECHKG